MNIATTSTGSSSRFVYLFSYLFTTTLQRVCLKYIHVIWCRLFFVFYTVYREISDKTIELLTEGFVNIYHPPLKPLKSQLLEIVKKQESLCDELHRENLKLSEAIYSSELHEMFDKIKLYKQKLVNIKKDMMAIHEQVSRSKVRLIIKILFYFQL